jgi:3-hydroxyisobutyrate dehydrogenase-like beta-hydroxyacid dehydrogenase
MRIAVIAPGAMGSAIAGLLTAHKATVLTTLDGRSAASIARAHAAGMEDAPLAAIAAADILLSILPPIEAMPLARRLGPALAASPTKPLYVDCNAINPGNKQALAAYLAGLGCTMVDGAIVGLPPAPGRPDPRLYVSGPAADRALALTAWGLDVQALDGPIGAAAALKMAYAGINKGMTALGAALFLAAGRAGAAADLRREMARSIPDTLSRLEHAIPNMYPKAYRWVGEMREIAAFLGEDEAAAMLFEGAARLFERLAADRAGEHLEIDALDAALGRTDG